jgi:hypothetical protein
MSESCAVIDISAVSKIITEALFVSSKEDVRKL